MERVAGWSAAHRKTAVFGWLVLVIAAVTIGHALGTSSVPSYDPGQAGQAERVLNQPGVQSPPLEEVLIQARAAGGTFASDPGMRQAAEQIAAALHPLHGTAEDIRSPADPGGGALVSADGRSALVIFTIAGNTVRSDT